MAHLVVPEKICPFEVQLVGVVEGTHLQEEVISVGRLPVKVCEVLGWKSRLRLWLKKIVKPEIGEQHERAAVIRVIAHEQVRHWSFRRRSFDCRMRIDDAGRSIETGIGDAPDAYASV